MGEFQIQKQMAMSVMNVDYYPAMDEEDFEREKCNKFSLENVTALGVAFEPLTAAMQNIISGGTGMSGIYKVNTHGLKMATFNNKSGYLGSLLTEGGTVGGGQAVITPLVCDPTMLFMAAALINIEKKLDVIKELQEEILDFLKQKEKAKLKGNVNILFDVLNNYKYNWNNEKYKTNKHILVQEIRRDAEQSIILYREQIEKELKKQNSLHSDQGVKAILQRLKAELKDYQLALYLYSFSSFLEIMLLENFDFQYLNSVSQKIEEYSFQYRELYTLCYNKMEGSSKTSVQSYLLKGLAGVSKGAGDVIAKIPVVSKTQIDETLIETGSRLGEFNLQRTRTTMSHFVDGSVNCTRPFIDNIDTLNRIYNQPLEILFSSKSIYFVETGAKEK